MYANTMFPRKLGRPEPRNHRVSKPPKSSEHAQPAGNGAVRPARLLFGGALGICLLSKV